MKITAKPGAVRQIEQSPAVKADLRRRANAFADACNAESSWGGYEAFDDTDEDRPRTGVVNIAEHSNEARNLRLLRNLDAAR